MGWGGTLGHSLATWAGSSRNSSVSLKEYFCSIKYPTKSTLHSNINNNNNSDNDNNSNNNNNNNNQNESNQVRLIIQVCYSELICKWVDIINHAI
jgi:hypothetical protein